MYLVRKILVAFCLSIIVYVCDAQQPLNELGYMFPDFQEGVVLLKNGASVKADLNYDMLEQKMLYRENDGDGLMVLTSRDVLAIYVDKRKFVPYTPSVYVFFEEKPLVNGCFYIRHKDVYVKRGKNIGYGIVSETVAVSNITVIAGKDRFHNLNADVDYKMVNADMYYILNKNKYKLITGLRSVVAAFKPYKSDIEAFAEKYKTDFTNEADVAAILNYAYGLSNGANSSN